MKSKPVQLWLSIFAITTTLFVLSIAILLYRNAAETHFFILVLPLLIPYSLRKFLKVLLIAKKHTNPAKFNNNKIIMHLKNVARQRIAIILPCFFIAITQFIIFIIFEAPLFCVTAFVAFLISLLFLFKYLWVNLNIKRMRYFVVTETLVNKEITTDDENHSYYRLYFSSKTTNWKKNLSERQYNMIEPGETIQSVYYNNTSSPELAFLSHDNFNSVFYSKNSII
jgi:hypothetical protein